MEHYKSVTSLAETSVIGLVWSLALSEGADNKVCSKHLDKSSSLYYDDMLQKNWSVGSDVKSHCHDGDSHLSASVLLLILYAPRHCIRFEPMISWLLFFFLQISITSSPHFPDRPWPTPRRQDVACGNILAAALVAIFFHHCTEIQWMNPLNIQSRITNLPGGNFKGMYFIGHSKYKSPPGNCLLCQRCGCGMFFCLLRLQTDLMSDRASKHFFLFSEAN